MDTNPNHTYYLSLSLCFCQVQCISSEEYGADEDDTWNEYSDSKNIVTKKKPRTESSIENSYLVAHVTASNLSRDRLVVTLLDSLYTLRA